MNLSIIFQINIPDFCKIKINNQYFLCIFLYKWLFTGKTIAGLKVFASSGVRRA